MGSKPDLKRKYPDADDMDPDKSGDQPATDTTISGGSGSGSVPSEKPNNISPSDTLVPCTRNFTFKRLFNQYITNTPKTISVTKATSTANGRIDWNWFRIPIDDTRFYLTPRAQDYILTNGTEFKIESVSVELKQFTVFTDQVYATSAGEKFTQFPTANPFVFIYEDDNYYLPRRDVDAMEEWEIKSNTVFQAERSDCTLKRHVSVIPKGMSVDEEDLEIFNTNNWTIKDLQAPINITRKVDMPWVSIAENLYYDGTDNDTEPIAYRFPHINTIGSNNMYSSTVLSDVDTKARVRTILNEPDKIKPWEKAKQAMLVDGKPFGGPLKEFLIKPVPYSDIVNKPINYCIEFYATYTMNVSVRSSPMLYKTPRMYTPTTDSAGKGKMKHWAGHRNYGMGNVSTKKDNPDPKS